MGEEIILTPITKGVAVHAVPNENNKDPYAGEWILLVSHTSINLQGELVAYRYASIRLNGHITLGPSKKPILWGKVNNYIFYVATKEEKKQLRDLLLEHNMKYIKSINKLIDR